LRFLEVLSLLNAENFDTIHFLYVIAHNGKRLVTKEFVIVDFLLQTSAQGPDILIDVTRCLTKSNDRFHPPDSDQSPYSSTL